VAERLKFPIATNGELKSSAPQTSCNIDNGARVLRALMVSCVLLQALLCAFPMRRSTRTWPVSPPSRRCDSALCWLMRWLLMLCVLQSGTAPFLDMKKYRLAYYRDLLALTPYVDYVYRFEHEKEENMHPKKAAHSPPCCSLARSPRANQRRWSSL
jgi:hypothetical protein